MKNVYAVKINHNLDKSIFNYFMSYLAKDKQERISRFKRLEDAQRALIADVLLRTVICSELDIKNKDIILDKNEYGKPFLKYNHNFHFNISHSGEWAICATDVAPIGIDIEHIQPIDFDVAKRFFSKGEYDDLMNINNARRLSYFYDLWTLKESYIKAIGRGLSIPLNSFSLRINGEKDITLKIGNMESRCFFKQYSIDKNYKLAVCGLTKGFSDEVIIKEISDIYEEISIFN